MEDLVIELEGGEGADKFRSSHPHEIHIYSEVDKVDHGFMARPEATIGSVVERFYKRTGLAPTPLDRFKCETNSRDLSVLPNLTIEQADRETQCSSRTWIFTNEPIEISVAGRDHAVRERKISFVEVVTLRFGSYDTGEQVLYTVTYRNADQECPDGELVRDQCVRIKDGTRFHVKRTNRS